MAISIECTGCGKKLKVKDEAAGKRIKCPECQAALTVPKPEAPASDDDFLGGLDEAVKQEKKRPRAIAEEEEGAEDYDAPAALAPRRRTKKGSSKQKSSSTSGGVLKAIGGGVFALLVILGIVGKVVKAARLGGAFNQTVSWQKFSHPKGGASVDMPGRASFDAKSTTDPNAQVYTCSTRNFSCSLTTVALPPLALVGIANDPTIADQMFAEMKKAMVGMKAGARLVSESNIQMGSARGMELRIEIGDLLNVSRSYLTGTHLVASEIVFKKGRELATDRDRFFNSLQLTGVAAGPGNPMPGMNAPNVMPGAMPTGAMPAAAPGSSSSSLSSAHAPPGTPAPSPTSAP